MRNRSSVSHLTAGHVDRYIHIVVNKDADALHDSLLLFRYSQGYIYADFFFAELSDKAVYAVTL